MLSWQQFGHRCAGLLEERFWVWITILSSKVYFSEHKVFNSDVWFCLFLILGILHTAKLGWICSVEALRKPYVTNKDPGVMYFDEAWGVFCIWILTRLVFYEKILCIFILHIIPLISTFVRVSGSPLLIAHVDLFSRGSAIVLLTLVTRGATGSRIDPQDSWKRSINSSVFTWVDEDSITGTVSWQGKWWV